ncbi:hypothetical protein GP486_008702 [Trichoglossum hirsutum]|uniref:Uncharacterized protein n=1 Tax=Trichoglossum hirsutum TaxID=265104 RepID=A0A9P8L4C9_9PEZI|nr:hypothetical protein GP486_008702 [Trichoglossum hirsutum]
MATSVRTTKHYLRALSRWPADILRPELSFQATMRARFLLPSSTTTTASPPSSSSPPPPTTAAAAKDSKPDELSQINALYSLLENRYSRKYPLSDAFLRPAFNPTYYDDLLAEINVAPTRSWVGRMLNRWKGFLRFS